MAAHVANSFGEEERDNWELWDFGPFQSIANACTGDFRHVHGPAAPSQNFGGPFDFHHYEGKAVLVSRHGDDLTRVLHTVSDVQTMHFAMRSCGRPCAQLETEEVATFSAPSRNKEARCEVARVTYLEKVLSITCGAQPDCEHFKAEWYWYVLGTPYDGFAWTSRLTLPWVVEYIYGGSTNSKSQGVLIGVGGAR